MTSTSRFTETLTLNLKPSRYLLLFIVLIHSVVAVIALSTPAFPLWVRVLMAVIVGISAWRSLKVQYWRHSERAIQAIRWLDSGEWQIQLSASDQWQTVTLANQSFVKRWWVILGFKHPQHGFVNAIIPPDSVDASTWQSLMMRWHGKSSI